VWDRILKGISKQNKLSFSGTELDKVLESSEYTPKSLITLFEKDLGRIFNADSGVREKYSVKRHTLMVIGQFEKYFTNQELPAGMSKNFFRTFLALHDIGKSEAIKKLVTSIISIATPPK